MGIFNEQSDLFTVYEAEITFRDRILGGVPKNPKVIQGWLKSKAGIGVEQELARVTARTMAENGSIDVTAAQVMEMPPDDLYDLIEQSSEKLAADTQTNGFKRDEDNGLYIEARQIKALIKESTNILFAGERWGATRKGPKSFVAERVFVNPDRIYLGTMEPGGVEQVNGTVSDARGKRSVLSLYEYVEQPTINFEVHVTRDELTPEQWADLWVHAQENGLGAVRSQSFGRFDIEGWNIRK